MLAKKNSVERSKKIPVGGPRTTTNVRNIKEGEKKTNFSLSIHDRKQYQAIKILYSIQQFLRFARIISSCNQRLGA